ncbi:MAG: cupin domain-containing protein [Chloroflexi bacterium]|nr:cupin domain-containing protein [Chloroflexota bacterium]
MKRKNTKKRTMAEGIFDGRQFETVRYPTDEILLRVVKNGSVQVAEYRSEDREGSPPHLHPWDEIEYVIEGEVEFFLRGAWRRCVPGSVQMLPAGAAHAVRVPKGTARVLMITMGAPYDGFARDIAKLYAKPKLTLSDVAKVAGKHGVKLAS